MKKDLHGVILRDNLPHNASFWQVGLSDVVLSKYSNKFQNFTNWILDSKSQEVKIPSIP